MSELVSVEVFIYSVHGKPLRRADVVEHAEITMDELHQSGIQAIQAKADRMVREFYQQLKKHEAGQ